MRTILLALTGLALPALLGAQNRFPPDSLRNLRVLPATMTPRQVINAMRAITGALGVRCTYCHVGEEGQDLATYDFVSDDKRTKRTARIMFQMLGGIDSQLSRIPERPTPNVQVTCITCHRGVPRPVPLGQLVLESVRAGGPDSGRAAYRSAVRRLGV